MVRMMRLLRSRLWEPKIAAALSTSAGQVELTLRCSDGLELSAQRWPPPDAPESGRGATARPRRILCLHGHADNSASFHLLAPALSSRLNARVVAFDFPGHGRSQHRSRDAPSIVAEYVYHASEAADALGWDRFAIVGHSLGAAVGVMFAAAFPERVDALALLEGGTPRRVFREEDASSHIRSAVERRRRSNRSLCPKMAAPAAGYGGSSEDQKWEGRPGLSKIYSSLSDAVIARMEGQRLLPGGWQRISREAAEALVRRGTVPAPPTFPVEEGVSGADKDDGGGNGPVVFCHDPRVMLPMLQYLSPGQWAQIYRDVRCSVCRIMAEDGWPFDRRLTDPLLDGLKPAVDKVLPGNHHFHADPDTAPAGAEEVAAFLDSCR